MPASSMEPTPKILSIIIIITLGMFRGIDGKLKQ